MSGSRINSAGPLFDIRLTSLHLNTPTVYPPVGWSQPSLACDADPSLVSPHELGSGTVHAEIFGFAPT